MVAKAFGINVNTSGDGDIIDLTPKVAESVGQSEITNGTVLVFVPGATAAITTIEYEPGLLADLPEFFERILPSGKSYHHDRTWGGWQWLRSSSIGVDRRVVHLPVDLWKAGSWDLAADRPARI
jgi:thiamine phosphate synthase YjbQ (UPF0047 family)